MFYSITFTKKAGNTRELRNTLSDWCLLASPRPTISPPGINTKYVTVPGREIPYDMSTYLTGSVVRGPRSGSISFLADNTRPGYNWNQIKDDLIYWLHGSKCRMYLESEPDYYYEGRFAIESLSSEPDWSTVTISYQVNPDPYSAPGSGDSEIEFPTDYEDLNPGGTFIRPPNVTPEEDTTSGSVGTDDPGYEQTNP